MVGTGKSTVTASLAADFNAAGEKVGLIFLEEELKETLQRMVAHLANVASAYNYNLAECLEAAYEEIKDRKGQMVNGVFIKEDDL